MADTELPREIEYHQDYHDEEITEPIQDCRDEDCVTAVAKATGRPPALLFDVIRARGAVDGAENLKEGAEALHALADELLRKHHEGWKLVDSEIADDYGLMVRDNPAAREYQAGDVLDPV
jgi:hypothetical protein